MQLGVNTITSGTAASPATPRMTIAGCQPAIPMSSWARGMIVNWPNEPPALMMPVVTERFASGIQRLAAEMSIAGPMRAGAGGGRHADQQREHNGVAGERRCRVGRRKKRRPGDHHPSRPPAVRHSPGHRLRHAPHELGDAEGEADGGVADAGMGVERADEERLRLAQAEPERENRPGGKRDAEVLPALLAHGGAHFRVITISRYSLGTTMEPSPERLNRSIKAMRSRWSAACAAGSSAAKVLSTGP